MVSEPVKPEQLAKAFSPIDATVFSKVSEPMKPLQPLKAFLPIVVTDCGIINSPVIEEKPTINPLGMTCTLSPILTEERGHPSNECEGELPGKLTPPQFIAFQFNVVNEQLQNAPKLM